MVFTGQPWRRIMPNLLRNVISSRGTLTYNISWLNSYIPLHIYGPSTNGCGHPGSFPPGVKSYKFMLVGINYFTMWIEVEPLSKITVETIWNFYLKIISPQSNFLWNKEEVGKSQGLMGKEITWGTPIFICFKLVLYFLPMPCAILFKYNFWKGYVVVSYNALFLL